MMVTTTDKIPGREVKEVLGVVFGCCVQMKHVGKDLRAMGRNIIGGESNPIQSSWKRLVEPLWKE